MDLQFIRLLHKELTADYSYVAYLKDDLIRKLHLPDHKLYIIGVPFIISFKNCEIKNKVWLLNKDTVIDAIINSKLHPEAITFILFAMGASNFIHSVTCIPKSVKNNLEAIKNKIRLDDKLPFFKDVHLQLELVSSNKKLLYKASCYNGTKYICSVAIPDRINNPTEFFIELLKKYRFVNLSFTNITKRNTEFVLRTVEYFINDFADKFKYLNILSIGSPNQLAMIDKINITYVKYSDFYPTFINDKVYCLWIQTTSSLFNELNYYTTSGYIQNYIIGGSNLKDDLIELDGELNIEYRNVNIDTVIDVVEHICKNYTLKGEK